MEMRKVLLVAYYFPPSGGGGVQRVLKYVQYLPDFGWAPIVLTVSNGTFPVYDESLLARIPSGTIVERTVTYEPFGLYRRLIGGRATETLDLNVLAKGMSLGIRERLSNWIRASCFVPDARIGWLLSAVRAGKALAKKYDVKAIISSSLPYTCALIGRQLKRKTGLPWVAGFRDPWTGFLTTPDRWWLPALIDRYLERSVMREADCIECAWEGIISDATQKYPELPRNKFVHIPNGYDVNEFCTLGTVRNERFTITYVGTLYGLRSVDVILTALERLRRSENIGAKGLCFRVVGRVGGDVMAKLNASAIRDAIEILPYVPYSDSIRYMRQSDVLLLVVDDTKDSNVIVPGKTYEYLAASKPIIALAPAKSAVAELLRETRSGEVFEGSESDKCVGVLSRYLWRWRNQEALYEPNTKSIKRFERREGVRELAKILDDLTNTSP
jgi:glycosyltransferase involved in cell wall biosynthesis